MSDIAAPRDFRWPEERQAASAARERRRQAFATTQDRRFRRTVVPGFVAALAISALMIVLAGEASGPMGLTLLVALLAATVSVFSLPVERAASQERAGRGWLAEGAKRLLDTGVAAVGLVVAAPLLMIAGVAVALTMGRPIFFSQVRPGFRGRPITMYKLRTMLDAVDQNGTLLSDAERLTPLGRLLRRWSIDELPQLWNVVRGDLSLVGPRPQLMDYLPLYTPEQARRHDVKPGLTGWAQVNGRNGIGWARRLELDVWYVDNWSFWLDLKIAVMTAKVVLLGSGVSAPGEATMSRFCGTTKPEADLPRIGLDRDRVVAA